MPFVSFCVPSYNNSLAVKKIADDLLSSECANFEVVICDDASTDDTVHILSGIHDRRFRLIINPQNLGAHKNWLKTLESGKGEYLYLVMGRDKLYGEKITGLIECLNYARKNNISCLRDKYDAKQDMQIFTGIKAMIKFLGFNHPTGLIFSREGFNAIKNREKYFAISDMYPENYIARDLLLQGSGAIIKSGVFRDEAVIDYAEKKSTVENDKSVFASYYSPARRTKQFFELIDMIDELPEIYTQCQRNKYVYAKFSELLLSVTKAWRGLCADSKWQAHYNQPVRTVTRREMFSNIIQAVNDARQHLKENQEYNFMRGLSINYLALKRFRRVLTGS